MTKDDLLSVLNQKANKANKKRKKQFIEKDIFGNRIKISLLKKIDELFERGLTYYLDPKNPIKSGEESIFFRKERFNAELSFGAMKVVNRFEREKISLSTLAKLADFKIKRKLSIYSLTDKAETVAKEIRTALCPQFDTDDKRFFKNFIGKLSDYNILVFEFIEAHNASDKSNINGFFLAPNVIVLKRNQKALKREIFTLSHELGHYLLNNEEIDGTISSESAKGSTLNEIERWCNDFAFYFLAGDYSKKIEGLSEANSSNDYYHNLLDEIAQNTPLSTLALYTRLLVNNIISPINYNTISKSIKEQIKDRELSEKVEREKENQKALQDGKKSFAQPAKPIISPLYLKTLQGALYYGLINEVDFCNKLKIKPEKLERFLI